MDQNQREKSKEKRLELFDQLCQSEKFKDFPISSDETIETEEVLPKDFDEFYDRYASMFQTSLLVLQPIENRISEIESTVEFYGQQFFRQQEDQFVPIVKPQRSFSLTAEELEKLEPNSELATIFRRRKQIFLAGGQKMNEEERNTVENLTYKPFQLEVYHDWIAETTVDVLDVLDKVTNAQGFQENFQFLWNKIIRSETSQHLLIDAFWWFYLKYFVKIENGDEQAEKYLNRIAKNYVELLLSVDPWFRDKFFKIYSSYLAQAVYEAFSETCPDSRLSFHEKFKEFLSTTITEWISGSQATPEAFRNWKIRTDASSLNSDSVLERKSSPIDIFKRIRRLEEELESLGGTENNGEQTVRSTVVKTPLTTPRKGTNSMPTFRSGETIDDLFNLSQRSLLVSRFLDQCDIQPNIPQMRNIHRMHVLQWPKQE